LVYLFLCDLLKAFKKKADEGGFSAKLPYYPIPTWPVVFHVADQFPRPLGSDNTSRRYNRNSEQLPPNWVRQISHDIKYLIISQLVGNGAERRLVV
jgi:hypothetical protein